MQQKPLKICSVCLKPRKLFKSNPPTCGYCIPKKKIKPISKKGLVRKKEKTKTSLQMLKAFEEFYNNHPTKCCEETGIPIPVLHTYNVHHILPKQLYPKLKCNPENFMLLSEEAHSRWETLRIGENIQKKYQLLLEKYGKPVVIK